MKSFSIIAHTIWSALFLILLKYLHSGRWTSFRHSNTQCLILIVMGIILFAVTLLICIYLRDDLLTGRKTLLLLIAILDFFVLTDALLSLFSCVDRRGKREFWGENREIDRAGPQVVSVGDITLCSRIISAGASLIELSLTNKSSALSPHQCVGRINPFEDGHLLVRIVDPETELVLGKSKKRKAKWSVDPSETFDFEIPCEMYCGRYDKQYVVRCELWFLADHNDKDEKLAEVMVRINGWY